MKFLIILVLSLIACINLYSQRRITGKVISLTDSLPVDGADVFIQGTGTKTVARKGIFVLHMPTDTSVAVLLIRHIGFKPISRTIQLPQMDTVTIILSPSEHLLDEIQIVSTGYQKIPKERATGSFEIINNELFNQQVGTDVLSRLPAIANSVVMDNNEAGAPQMMIRGLSTIRGPKDPLIVVDNFPYEGDLSNINPNIVESITILKDASASSIWGARAANGVIVITTKSGHFNQPISLSFNSNLTIGRKPDLGYIRQMSSDDYISLEQELFKRGFYDSKISSSSYPVISPVVDILNKVRTGKLTQAQADKQMDDLRKIDVRDQFNQYMYKPSVKQQYFIGAHGGTDRFSWTSSVGYDHNKDNLGATYERINLRFQNTYNPVRNLSLRTSLYYSQSHDKSGRYGYNDVSMRGNSFVPYMQMADDNGKALPVNKDYNPGYIDTIGGGKLLDWNYYPLEDWRYQTSSSTVSDILATATLNYEVIKGLNASLNYQYERQVSLNSNLADINSYVARDYINRFAQIVDNDVVFVVPRGGILDKYNSVLKSNSLRGQLSFDNTYGKHNITAIAGMEGRSNNASGHQGRFYGYDPNNLTTGGVDYAHSYPTLPRGSSVIQRSESLSEKIKRFVSYFANAAYTFDNRYTVSGSARRDASNLFGVKTNDQWNPFWSAGVAWKLSNERFYDIDFLPYLNLRATYGFSGNIDPSMVAVNTIAYTAQRSFFNGQPMARFNNYYNPELKWETSKMLNIGIDFNTKNSRLIGSIEFYRKNGDNLFGVAPSDYTTGIPPSEVRNVANMKGYGWDFQFKSLNIDRKVKWRTILNFSIYKDQIVKYLVNNTLARQYLSTYNVPISGIKGRPVYALYAYKWAGLDPATGEPQGYLNGQVSKDYTEIIGVGTKVEDLRYYGSAIPTKFGSLINEIKYKNISLQIGISFKLGYWFRRSSINYTDLFNSWNGHSDYALRWQNPGDEARTNVPVNLYTTNYNRDAFYSGSSVLVEKGDHIRVQYINLTYDFEMSAKKKSYIKGLQLNLNASNLGLLWRANKANIDPDFNGSIYNIPTPANYTIGVKVEF